MEHGFNKNDDNDLTRELEEAIRKSTFGTPAINPKELKEAAENLKMIYDSFVDAGFDKGQALILVAQLMVGSGHSKD